MHCGGLANGREWSQNVWNTCQNLKILNVVLCRSGNLHESCKIDKQNFMKVNENKWE